MTRKGHLFAVAAPETASEAVNERRRLELGDWLVQLGDLVVDRFVAVGDEAVDPRLVIVVAVDDDGPLVMWNGEGSDDDLEEAAVALGDCRRALLDGVSSMTEVASRTRHDWRCRRNERLAGEARRHLYERSHPWCCDYCPRRFATRRGALQHERSCPLRRR